MIIKGGGESGSGGIFPTLLGRVLNVHLFFSPRGACDADSGTTRQIKLIVREKPGPTSRFLPFNFLFRLPSSVCGGVRPSSPPRRLRRIPTSWCGLVGYGVIPAMSLTSRIFGLFSTTANSNSDPPASRSSAYNGNERSYVAKAGDWINKMRGIEPPVQEEEEPRPPYLHVCRLLFCEYVAGVC